MTVNDVFFERSRHYVGETVVHNKRNGTVIALYPFFLLVDFRVYKECISYVDLLFF